MPKRRSVDATAGMSLGSPSINTAMPEGVPPAKAQKTERSHEENQERAYIAASRRADRSLEARVQSAKMASEIHRRRTGRGLKVSEEIVIKEEMYEEEEDDLPRQYRYLTAHLQTNSPDFNHRVNAYVTTQAAMATMARYNEVNRLFNESFGGVSSLNSQANSAYMAPLFNNAPFSPSGGVTSPTQAMPQSRSQSTSAMSQLSDASEGRASGSSDVSPHTAAISSPPGLTPGSSSTEPLESKGTPCQTPIQTFPVVDPQPQQSETTSHQSIFTSELPNEVKMMAQFDMNDSMAPYFLGTNEASAFQFLGNQTELATVNADDLVKPETHAGDPLLSWDDGTNDEWSALSSRDLGVPHESHSRLGTPSRTGADSWESFVDFEQ